MKLLNRFRHFSGKESSAAHLAVGALLVITILYSVTMI